MDWYDVTDKAHERTLTHGCSLSSLQTEWERELAALWRLEADVNNGAYLQFLCNWGHESYRYASQALKKIGAVRMAWIVDTCQALVDEHAAGRALSFKEMHESLPKEVLARILDLSYEFMDYPEELPELGLRYYQQFLDDNDPAPG